MENAKELQKLANVFNVDNIVTSEDIEQVLKGILVIMNSFKKDNQSLNKETKVIVENLFNKILNEHDKLKESVTRETLNTKDEVNKKLENSIKEVKSLIEEFKILKPKDGKDAIVNEDKIVQDVLAKIKLPEQKEIILDDADAIADKLETLKGDKRLDASAIKNLPKFKGGNIGGVVARNIYQMGDVVLTSLVNNDTLKWNSTNNRWENGAAVAVVDGSGTTNQITYWVDADTIGALDVATYPSLTELSYVKGLTSAIQTQLGNKQPLDTQLTDLAGLSYAGNALKYIRVNAGENGVELATVSGGTIDGSGTTNELTYWVDSDTIGSLATATYPSLTELSYVKGVTSAIQTQLNGKAATLSGTMNEIAYFNGASTISSLATATYPSLTELSYVKGVTSALQTQLNAKQASDTQLTSLAGLSYAGNANKVVRVNAGETDFELATVSGGQTLYECVVATSGGDYTTLGAALAAGKTRIFIRNGTYNETGENSIVSNTVIVGESMQGVIIEVDGTTNDRFLCGSGITLTNLQISNLTFKCTVATDYILDSASAAGSGMGNILFDNVQFDGGGTRWGNNTSGCAVSGYFIFRNCYFTRLTTQAGAQMGANAGAGAFEYLEISGCKTDDSSNNKYLINGDADATFDQIIIENNSFSSTDYGIFNGIRPTGSLATALIRVVDNISVGNGVAFDTNSFTGKGTISGNTFIAKSDFAVCLSGVPAYCTISNNVFQGYTNTECITIAAVGTNSIVCNNTFTTYRYGVNINNSGANTVRIYGNTFEGASAGGYDISDSGTGTLIYNNLGLNAIQSIETKTMKNTSGGALAAGDVVILKSVAAGDEVTTTTTAGDNKVFGVAIAAIADTAIGKIQTKGKTTALKVNGTTDIAIGDFISTYTTAKIGKKASDGDMAFAIALEAYSTNDSNGVIDALLIKPRKVGSIARSTDVQIFTSTGANTWTKPTNAKYVEVLLIGAGGGGGSGRKGAALSSRGGGGGGGNAGNSLMKFDASILGSTETVTVGAGGAGGTAQTTNSTDGNNGTSGGNTTFGSWLIAGGGEGGYGGQDSVGGNGGNTSEVVPYGYGYDGLRFVSTGAGGTGGTDSDGQPGSTSGGAGAGGGGGSIDITNTVFNGGDGSSGSIFKDLTGYAFGAGGVATSGSNGTGTTANYPYSGGGGGGGGARHSGGNAYAGGNGGIYGGGGGGGGASTDAVGNSGAGGNGANGIAIITTYF